VRPCRFEIAACPDAHVQRLQRELGVSGPLAQVLVRRGMAEPARARGFLEAREEHPPEAFAGIEEAVAIVLRHLASGSRITIHGDYDVDGICSTAVLVRTLRALGTDIDFYLPDRARDGYGLNVATVRRLAQRGTGLLITVDCAVTALEEVAAPVGPDSGMPIRIPRPYWQPLITLGAAPMTVEPLSVRSAPPATRTPFRLKAHESPASGSPGQIALMVRFSISTAPPQIETASWSGSPSSASLARSQLVLASTGLAGIFSVAPSKPMIFTLRVIWTCSS
jgi:hypothetical protein